MKQKPSELVEEAYQDYLARIRDAGVRQVLSLCLAELDDILLNPEKNDFGNESFFRHRDEFHELIFGHNGPEDQVWEGLLCNRMYLNPEEYQFIVHCKRLYPFDSVVESGAGETSILFRQLGCRVTCIEWQEGPWVERAVQSGANVKIIRFNLESAEFDPAQVGQALQGQACDLLFVDSPVGTRNRFRVLESLTRCVEPKFVMIHDVHRDAENVYHWMREFDLKVLEYLSSWRGLLLLKKREIVQ